MMQNKVTEKQIAALEAEKVFAALESSEKGLSEDEAKRRSAIYGANKLPEKKTFHPALVLGKQFVSPMALLLLAAGVLALIAKMPELAAAVWAVVFINGLFSFLQEWRTDRALTLLGRMIPRNVRVIRSGKEETIPAIELAIGDLLIVAQGEVISADARLVEANELFVDNSVISGESIPLNRLAGPFVERGQSLSEITNLLFAGSTVVSGSGKALVYAIGADTEVGQVSTLATKIDVGHGTLGIQINKVVKAITFLAFAMGILVFVLSLFWIHLDWIAAFLYALAIVTANIPEGLLPTVNLCLAMGAQRMAKHNALIRGLPSVETLSSATVICTDKTGTLTKNQLMVRAIWTPDNLVEITGEGYQKDGTLKIANEATRKGVEKLLAAAVVCNEASLTYDEEKREFAVNGSPTEGCLLIAAEKFGYSIAKLRSSFLVLERHPFNSERKKMSVLLRNDSCPVYDIGAKYLFAKGAPSVLVPDCGVQYKGSHVVALSEEEKKAIMEQNDRFASEGFRVLAFAYKKIETDSYEEDDMVFLGLAVTYDPPREEVRPAIENCRKAGLKITIITGDYGLTAAAIGRQVGIIEDGDYRIIKGSELAVMGDSELLTTLRSKSPLIFSRTTPQDKLRIVEGYKNIGEIVAVTGDGVNDVLALRSANMGIAMGKNGTDVARGAADMILLDDNFSTIVEAVKEGRGIYANIKKFITYILVSNVPELIPTLFVVFLHVPPALTVLQILSVDLGTDLVPALALGAEEPDSGLLFERPRKVSDRLIDTKLIVRSYAYLGIVESGLTMGAFFYVWFVKFGYSLAELQSVSGPIAQGMYSNSNPIMSDYRYATTLALASIVFAQIGNLFACRSDDDFFFQSFKKKNPFLYLGIAVELAIIGMIVYVPFFNDIFLTAPLDWTDVLLLLICPLVILLFDTLWKALKQVRRAKTQG
jgi:calcium-translocating P-type ATPase